MLVVLVSKRPSKMPHDLEDCVRDDRLALGLWYTENVKTVDLDLIEIPVGSGQVTKLVPLCSVTLPRFDYFMLILGLFCSHSIMMK